ncbi:hypothetical protein ACA910_017656 [Epithemia clementina (nom. ined.)]
MDSHDLLKLLLDSSGDEGVTVVTNDTCPCPVNSTMDEFDFAAGVSHNISRHLADEAETWETVVVAITVAIMFGFMVTDKIGPDWVMLSGLMLFIVTRIITLSEGLKGFSNEGILTVMALFVVADAVSRTGELDYYMGLLLGKPKSIAGAQIRLMIPIAMMSAFFNNTPIVAVGIPLVLRWAKTNGFPKQQLLIPLSYATILGGTCTLVGTSTNLVVQGLLQEDYPNEPAGNIGLFDLAIIGVPNALIGIAYMLVAAPFLLPYGRGGGSSNDSEVEDFLLGARLLPWSPAAGRTVKRSGLGNSAGIYLVNVRRAATGNVHRAVSRDFVLSVGDEVYFTGSVEEFSAFCDKHGLEVLTTDNLANASVHASNGDTHGAVVQQSDDETERMHVVNHLVDQINGREEVEPGPRPSRIVVTSDLYHTEGAVVVGVDCPDRPGLMSEISDALFEQAGLQIKHSEANVVADRSLSVWRCEDIQGDIHPDYNKVWSVLSSLLPAATDTFSSAILTATKTSGTRIVRAIVTKSSRLIGQTPLDVKFDAIYKAALVAYQKNGRNAQIDDAFTAGDLLVLATQDDSPLLVKPPPGFYNEKQKQLDESDDLEHDAGIKEVWANLMVVFEEQNKKQEIPEGEFLTAFVVTPKSPLEGKSLSELGFSKMPGAVLVSAERPQQEGGQVITISLEDNLQAGDVLWFTGSAEAIRDLQKVQGLVFYQKSESEKSNSALQDRRLVQAVVARGSPLIGQTIIDARFREEYGGVVVSIQRGSERVHEHPGTATLQAGDVLLIEAGSSFTKHQSNNYRVFALVSEVKNSSPPRPRFFLVCLLLIGTSFAIAAVELESLLVTASIAGIIMVSLGVLTQQEARDAIQWDLLKMLVLHLALLRP